MRFLARGTCARKRTKQGAKIRILVPLFKGDLAAPVRRVPRRFRETRQGNLPTKNGAIRLFRHSLSALS
jgi:hypothetical protein